MASRSEGASFWHRNGLSLVLAALTVITLVLHALSGWQVDQEARRQRHQPITGLSSYLGSGAFQSSLFENWESEFLQMGLFVVLTVKLRQKGSSESRPLDSREEKQKSYPANARPWPVRRGGWWKTLYEHSLSGALFLLFMVSFVGHWLSSWGDHVTQRLAEGQVPPTLFEHLVSADFCFESMQNWQSEFLSLLAIVLLSIFLREKDSSQSKPMEAPHAETGC